MYVGRPGKVITAGIPVSGANDVLVWLVVKVAEIAPSWDTFDCRKRVREPNERWERLPTCSSFIYDYEPDVQAGTWCRVLSGSVPTSDVLAARQTPSTASRDSG